MPAIEAQGGRPAKRQQDGATRPIPAVHLPRAASFAESLAGLADGGHETRQEAGFQRMARLVH